MVKEACAEAVAAASPDLASVQSEREYPDPVGSRRCSPDGATRAIADVRVRGTLLILERTREASALTVLCCYLHQYMMRDPGRFYSSAESAQQWGVAVISRLQLWRRKFDTSRALARIKEPGRVLAARPGKP